MASPSQAPAPAIDSTATARPAPVRKIAGNQREPGECDVVSARNPGRECQHCNEMCGPRFQSQSKSRKQRARPAACERRTRAHGEADDGRKRGQRAYNDRQADKPQFMLGYNTIKHKVHAVLIADQSSLLRGDSSYVGALKNAVFGPREFESRFHKNVLNNAIGRKSF
jgi:hypothetical protein